MPNPIGVGLSLTRPGSDNLIERQAPTSSARQSSVDETLGVLSVLNEPAIGLYPENITGFIGVTRDRFEERNSVVFVDHDISLIQTADQLIEIGLSSAAQGGYILSPGTPVAMSKDPQSAFGQLI